MIGVYFSGTGNTKYCLEKFISCYDGNIEAVSIESPRTAEKIVTHKEIIFAYPIYYSSLPKIVRDFIERKPEIWQGKRIFLIATMRRVRRFGASVPKIWGFYPRRAPPKNAGFHLRRESFKTSSCKKQTNYRAYRKENCHCRKPPSKWNSSKRRPWLFRPVGRAVRASCFPI